MSSRLRSWPTAIFVVALSLRLHYVATYRQTPILFDAEVNYSTGRSLSDGIPLDTLQLYVIGLKGPGYPYFLAAVFRAFSWADVSAARYSQAVLGAITCVLICVLGHRMANARVGAIAGLICAGYPTLIAFSGRFLSETVAMSLLYSGLLLIAGLARFSYLILIVGGGLIALACLTRPTLLPIIPFVMLAVCIQGSLKNWKQRVGAVLALGVPIIGALVAWNLLSRFMLGLNPIAGSYGMNFLVDEFLSVGHPDLRGWATDFDLPYAANSWWRQTLTTDPFYIAAAALNLAFQNGLWLADRLWRETVIVPPGWLDWIQRGLFIGGLLGSGVVLQQGRRFAPLLAVMAAYGVTSLLPIEPRRIVSFFPAMAILAAIGLDNIVTGLQKHRRLAFAGICLVAMLFLVWIAIRVVYPFTMMLVTSPEFIGRSGDALVLLMVWLACWLLYMLNRHDLKQRRAIVIGLGPGLIFAALWWGYVSVGSEPRWKTFSVKLENSTVTQSITLPEPIPAGQIQSATWLVDLQAESNPSELEVAVNRTRVASESGVWHAFSCPSVVPGSRCAVYEAFSSFEHKPLTAWPQWWALDVRPESLEGQEAVSLSLTARNTTSFLLGGILGQTSGRTVYGPTIPLDLPEKQTSLYRWLALDDWRLWGTTRLDSSRSTSEIIGNLPAELRSLQTLVQQGRAQFSIRLLVSYKSGRKAIY